MMCRYCYERAAHIVLGATWSEWFTRKTHQWGTAAAAVASKVQPASKTGGRLVLVARPALCVYCCWRMFLLTWPQLAGSGQATDVND